MMLLRHGHVVLEEEWSPYRLTDPHLLFSVSKSFTSTAVGLAIDAGLLSLDDPVVSFFDADELPETISDNLAAMKIRHLLTMTTGHDKDTVEALSRDRRMVNVFLGLDVEHEPGTVFVYNSGATYMLSAILQRLTGETAARLPAAAAVRAARRDRGDLAGVTEGMTTGGWGLSINTESLASFGQLVLQRGVWEGKQLVPAEWYEAATSKQVPNDTEENPDWKQGYGFQFWRGRHNTYRGDGAFGQFCLIFPEYDAALIITSATEDMQAILNTVWDHLLPALEGKEVTPVARPERLELARRRVRCRADRWERADLSVRERQRHRADRGPAGSGRDRHVHLRRPGAGLDGPLDIVCGPGDWQELNSVGVLKEADPQVGQRLVSSATATVTRSSRRSASSKRRSYSRSPAARRRTR